MTNEFIKDILKKLYDCKIDFTVIQSGKKSNKVNGLYKPATNEIVLHNRNFKSDNALMFTAIHELTHHIQLENGYLSTKSHNGAFWNTFYSLVDKAETMGIYSRTRSEPVSNKSKEISAVQKQIADLQKKQGELLMELFKECEEQGDRYEDVVEHDLQISKAKARELSTLAILNFPLSDELEKAIDLGKDPERKDSARFAAIKGATIAQVKAIAKGVESLAVPKDDELDATGRLVLEKKRLTAAINVAQAKIKQIDETLEKAKKNGEA